MVNTPDVAPAMWLHIGYVKQGLMWYYTLPDDAEQESLQYIAC